MLIVLLLPSLNSDDVMVISESPILNAEKKYAVIINKLNKNLDNGFVKNSNTSGDRAT